MASSADVGVAEPPPVRRWRLLPFNDPSRPRRLGKVVLWLLGVAAAVVVLRLLGVDIKGWLSDVWDALTEVPFQYLLAGWAVQTVQTTLTAVGWYYILRAAYPRGSVGYLQVLAAYSAGIALNGFLPANLGTFTMLLMFTAMIAGATFAGVVGGMVVQKIFFTVAGTFVYLYLFLSVPGSFNLQLGLPHDHPVAIGLVLVGAAFLLFILGRIFWRRLQGLWLKAKQGGAILARPRDYLLKVVLPSFGAWLAKLGVTGIFLAAYGIPVTFHTIMSVIGGNSLANTVSATPGGVGINQAVNTLSLRNETDAATATAYSLGQQLAITVWNIGFALVLVVWAFGWSGGKLLVKGSYDDAKVKVAEQKEQRAERKAEKKAAKEEAKASQDTADA
ncbi:MAG TPA: lysylphosphatidylglycerol synthase transmembrane domain-containing protein [Gaiellaceae bacterium]|nr:lysylphosphatidylglycerol synthase transmembrane domain-containing protein [Gaiellaceae bacterium]